MQVCHSMVSGSSMLARKSSPFWPRPTDFSKWPIKSLAASDGPDSTRIPMPSLSSPLRQAFPPQRDFPSVPRRLLDICCRWRPEETPRRSSLCTTNCSLLCQRKMTAGDSPEANKLPELKLGISFLRVLDPPSSSFFFAFDGFPVLALQMPGRRRVSYLSSKPFPLYAFLPPCFSSGFFAKPY